MCPKATRIAVRMKGHPPVFFVMPQGAHSEPGQFRPSPVAQWRAVAGSTSSSPPLVLISTDVGRHLSKQMSQQQEGTGVLDLAMPLRAEARRVGKAWVSSGIIRG